MKQIVITTPGNLDAKNKEKLTKAGYLVVEAKLPNSVYFNYQNLVENGNLLMSAMKGISDGDGNGRASFFRELHKRMIEQEAKISTK